jgi:homogentisate 1,2-dioxygenase
MYRIQPSVLHAPFVPAAGEGWRGHGAMSEANGYEINPNQLRWAPLPLPGAGATPSGRTFARSLMTMGGHGDPCSKQGLAIHMYACDESMGETAMMNSDGDFLIVPQVGELTVTTEMGVLEVPPRHIALIPRGIVFKVDVAEASRGYVLELFKGHFELPDLGPIGSNGLANPRDFQAPTAKFHDEPNSPWTLYNKFGGKLFQTTRDGTPFNVVAWHGNYCPYRCGGEAERGGAKRRSGAKERSEGAERRSGAKERSEAKERSGAE